MQKAVKQNGVIRSIIRGILGGDDGYTPPPQAALFFPFVSSLFGRVDQVNTVANFSRAPGVSTVEDFEGVLHNCKDGEARFWKARRVENLETWGVDTVGSGLIETIVVSANHLIITGFNDSNIDRVMQKWGEGFTVLGKYILSYELKADVPENIGKAVWIRFRNATSGAPDGDSSVTLTLTADWVRHEQEIEITIDTLNDGLGTWVMGNNPNFASGCEYRNWQPEKVTGLQDSASEYVSFGIESAPWHGANVDGVQYFPTDRDGNFINDLRGCLVEAGDAGYDPISGVQGTTQDETLNVSRPVVLLQAIVNNLTFACRSFLISDDPTPIQDATTLFIDSVNNDNNLRLVTASNSNYIFRKRTNNVGIDVVLANQGFESIARNLIASLTSDDGTHYSVNGETNQNENSDDVLALDTGDGLIHVGTNQTGNLHINAGISLLTVIG